MATALIVGSPAWLAAAQSAPPMSGNGYLSMPQHHRGMDAIAFPNHATHHQNCNYAFAHETRLSRQDDQILLKYKIPYLNQQYTE